VNIIWWLASVLQVRHLLLESPERVLFSSVLWGIYQFHFHYLNVWYKWRSYLFLASFTYSFFRRFAKLSLTESCLSTFWVVLSTRRSNCRNVSFSLRGSIYIYNFLIARMERLWLHGREVTFSFRGGCGRGDLGVSCVVSSSTLSSLSLRMNLSIKVFRDGFLYCRRLYFTVWLNSFGAKSKGFLLCGDERFENGSKEMLTWKSKIEMLSVSDAHQRS